VKLIKYGVGLIVLLIIAFNAVGVNDLGYRTVVEWPTGQTFVKFNKGIYIQAFGKATSYPDVIVLDHDRTASDTTAMIDQAGIGVRYQLGGEGAIFGKERFKLPSSTQEDIMLTLHKDFHSPEGLAQDLILSTTEEAMNLTAGLMSSEEAYATKRNIFTVMARDQIENGTYLTEVITVTTTDEITGKSIDTEVPRIKLDKDNKKMHSPSDLALYGVTLVGMQLSNPGFEPKTKDQIADKRAINMDIITSKANAEKAKQATITAEENGKANVMTAQYLEEVEKVKQVVIAERAKEVAVIKASQLVDVAKQAQLEAIQFKLKAIEIKQANILEGEGLAEKKRLIMEADGALQQKIDAWERTTIAGYKYLGNQKWVSEITFGANAEGQTGDAMTQFMSLLSTKAAKDLSLDMTIKK